jgi:tetratricopeptide (TPR) repeat protein
MRVSRETHVVTLCLLLAVATLAFYNPIVHNQFIDFDNAPYILKNPHVQSGLTWQTVKWAFTTFHTGNWHPVTWLSHAVDCQFFRLNPIGHHYTNLLLHTCNAVLVFLLLRRATGRAWASLLVGTLFALHPVNVESVAWAAERKNVLSMLFFLLAMHAYDRYARSGRNSWYCSVTILFALGLMAKPQIVTLPFVLLLWDYWPLERMGAGSVATAGTSTCFPRSFGFLVWEKWPLFVLAAADSVVTVLAQRAGNAVRTVSEVSAWVRLQNIFVSYVGYLGKAFWPSRLVPMYPRSGTPFPAWQVIASGAVLVLLSLIVLYLRDRRYLMVGWLWFLGTLVPMIGIITVGEQAMADRYAYLPLIGIFVAVVWSLDAIVCQCRIPSPWVAGAAVCALLILGCLTSHQLGYWHDDETLWRYTLSVTKGNYMAHDNLAIALAKQGRSDEAVAQFRAAKVLHEYPPVQLLSLANYELQVGHSQEAIEECDSVLRTSSDPRVKAVAASEIGLARLQLRHYDEAAQSYQNALRLNSQEGMAWMGSGLLALRNGDSGEAAADFSQAVSADPNDDVKLFLLADGLRRSGQAEKASRALMQARNISANVTQAQATAANYLALVGITDSAPLEQQTGHIVVLGSVPHEQIQVSQQTAQ